MAIVGYFNEEERRVVCVPCANRIGWDLERACSPVFDEGSGNADALCPECLVRLDKANVLRVCEACGALRTQGGHPCRT